MTGQVSTTELAKESRLQQESPQIQQKNATRLPSVQALAPGAASTHFGCLRNPRQDDFLPVFGYQPRVRLEHGERLRSSLKHRRDCHAMHILVLTNPSTLLPKRKR